jgi:protein TonB
MDKDNSYFYLSGFLSFALFSFFMFIALYMLISSDKSNVFALEKENYISVSLEVSVKKSKKTTTTVSKAITQQSAAKSKAKNVNIDSLFSDVWTQKIKPVKQKVRKIDNRMLQEISKKTKNIEKNDVKSVADIFKNIKTKETSDEASSESKASEVNEYLAKIQALVYKYFYPPSNSQGNTVRAVITLSAIGKVQDFRVLNYSPNEALNTECDMIKERLRNVLFPKNPENKSGTYTITLTAQE